MDVLSAKPPDDVQRLDLARQLNDNGSAHSFPPASARAALEDELVVPGQSADAVDIDDMARSETAARRRVKQLSAAEINLDGVCLRRTFDHDDEVNGFRDQRHLTRHVRPLRQAVETQQRARR